MSQVECSCCGDLHGRWRGPWCVACEEATRSDRLVALIFEDRSAIFGLYETPDQAVAAMRLDAELCEASRLLMLRVVGQGGARAELRREDRDGWGRREDAMNRADHENETAAPGFGSG